MFHSFRVSNSFDESPGPSQATFTSFVDAANFTIWYKADEGVVTSGSDVTDWIDQSESGGYDLVDVGTSPTLVATEINGLPIIRFGGAGALARTTGSPAPLDGATGFLISVVFKTGIIQSNKYLLSFPENLGSNGVDIVQNIVTVQGEARTDIDSFSPVSAGSAIDATPHIVTFVYDASENEIDLYDGSSPEDATVLTGSSIKSPLGGIIAVGNYANTGSFFWEGDIGEIIVVNQVVSSSHRQDIWDYLSEKWAITL